ncbi:aminotransferase class IV [Thermogemmatispora sp.]|uniref:aminotransferase class IV n=1 Tax=Thermogemmatispora sp. TaxID=1968838 RepID=UPI001D356E53|nr:aminotransferase class IV [Thermogemmatispora sp.]MBX5450778.1 aminotransferase class IV [Thermogemmatispora sp.]
MDQQPIWYVDGHWVHPQEACIPLTDVAVLRGYSVFESLRTYDRRPFRLDDHLDRLYRSAELIDLMVPYTRQEIRAVLEETIRRNAFRHASLRILVTGGGSEDGVLPSGKPLLAVMITPLPERDLEAFQRGLRVITCRLRREAPEAKTTNYIAAVRALKEAARHGAADALFVDEQGYVLEGTRSNFFVFRGDTLITPREGMLPGVTRTVVLELARDRFPIEERPIALAELASVDEAFLTASSKEIMPVVQIDELIVGTGQAGPRTWELEQRFIALVEQGRF